MIDAVQFEQNLQKTLDNHAQITSRLADHLGLIVIGIHQTYHTSRSPETCSHPICESTLKLIKDLEALVRPAYVPQP